MYKIDGVSKCVDSDTPTCASGRAHEQREGCQVVRRCRQPGSQELPGSTGVWIANFRSADNYSSINETAGMLTSCFNVYGYRYASTNLRLLTQLPD